MVSEKAGAAGPSRPDDDDGAGADSGALRFGPLTALRRFPRRHRGFWFSLAIDVIAPVLALGTRTRFAGMRHMPREGGVLVACNHLSWTDPILATAFCLAAGRVPRFMAHDGLWRTPVIRRVMASGGHICVHRGKAAAMDAYRQAVEYVRAGECVVVFPEGGYSKRTDHWPMRAQTGLARIALSTGVPVVPVGCWGTQRLLPPGSRMPRLLARHRVTVTAGHKLDLSEFAGERLSASRLRAATDRVMTEVVALVSDARGEDPPADVEHGT